MRNLNKNLKVNGCVNFPFNDPNFPSDNQGGMFVRLVVADVQGDENFFERWTKCYGGEQNFIRDECFMGDDKSLEAFIENEKTNPDQAQMLFKLEEENLAEYIATINDLPDHRNDSFHFPWDKEHWDSSDEAENLAYQSRYYLCVMTIGSTNWSHGEWRCTYSDLTEKGKQLYQMIQELYPNCQLFLLTFLDT